MRLRCDGLIAGSTLAGAAFLVRQFGAVLPVAALGGLLVTGGWRLAFRPRHLLAVIGPVVPAVLLGLYFDAQRGPQAERPLVAITLFWSDEGRRIVPLMLARLAAISSTLGLFALPMLLGVAAASSARLIHSIRVKDWRQRGLTYVLLLALALACSMFVALPGTRLAALGTFSLPLLTASVIVLARIFPLKHSQRWRYWALGVLLALLALGFASRLVVIGQSPLFPHLAHTLSSRGFDVVPLDGKLPQAIAVPRRALAIATIAAMLGSGLLVSAVGLGLPKKILRRPASVPLLFGLIVLGLTVLYYLTFDRYLLALLPIALLATLLVLPRGRWGLLPAMAGLVILTGWSVTWEREYLERRAALWQAGLTLVDQGIPPEEINGQYEWNGWYRGQAAIADAYSKMHEGMREADVTRMVENSLRSSTNRYTVAYTAANRQEAVLATVPYGGGHQVFALRRE